MTGASSDPPIRNNYFAGKVLTAEDLQVEQSYHIGQRRSHNRHLHGAGVVHGLAVSVGSAGVRVEPGMAIDCRGREIVVPDPAQVDLPTSGKVAIVAVAYAERLAEPVLVPDPEGEDTVYSRIIETFELPVGPEAEAGAAHPKGRRTWRPCGRDHPVPLARLRLRRGRWRVDRWYRRPEIRIC
jgi:hypothetical protein